MRQWRVGSVSMGVLLVFLGVVLLLSQFNDWDLARISMVWLPAVLVVLGAEIILAFFLAKQEQPLIKYDIFSILFICFLGLLTISGYLVSSTGVLHAFENIVESEEIEVALPTIEEKIDSDINQVVIHGSDNSTAITIEANNSEEVMVFGTIKSNTLLKEDMDKIDIASIHQSGDTLYVQLLSPPKQQGIGYDHSQYNTIVSVPYHVDIDIRSSVNTLNLDTSLLTANWNIEGANEVQLTNSKNADLVLEAIYVNRFFDTDETLQENENSEGKGIHNTYGQGSNHLFFKGIEELTVIN